ncbi:MAG: NAD(P)-dependent oxidoreductase [Kiritimatiellae bacterium]|nr:NAD(P)-dependent oxidoreductase [Kiritimatiellia bacterium]MCO5069489.1 NAD(P)-dependent oxidoreductase [Kiritimatiellia bacterium]
MIPTGVLGLGLIGSIWARHLSDDGWLSAAWNRTPKPDFPHWRATLPEVARAADALIICVSDPAAVSSVLDQLIPHLEPRHTVIQCSTIDPDSSTRFEARVRARGAAYLEAPFTGSVPGAESRTTVFYLGGDAATAARVQPVIDRLSKQQFRSDTGAQAAAFKLASNLAIAVQSAVLCESLALARSKGLSDQQFFDLLRISMAWSPVAKIKEPKLRTNDYSAQFAVRHMLKDVRLARDSGFAPLPMCEAVIRQLEAAMDRGWADQDYAILIKLLGE